MQINVRNPDRIARIVVGLVLLSLPFWLDSSWRWVGLIGLMPLVTGLAGRCPGYRLPARCANRSEPIMQLSFLGAAREVTGSCFLVDCCTRAGWSSFRAATARWTSCSRC